MRQVEGVAGREPVCARVVALDTQRGESQVRGEGRLDRDPGKSAPTSKSNEEWYTGQGYRVFGEEEEANPWVDEKTGRSMYLLRVFMRKDLT